MANSQSIINGAKGYIVACNNVSPLDNIKEGVTDEPLPPLNKWSDLVPIKWETFGGTNRQPLRLVLRSGIANPNTISIIQQAFRRLGRTPYPTYPGIDLTPDAESETEVEAFYACLGSYHGAGVAYMLAQHRGLFGLKKIDRIRIWKDEIYMGMILFISDL